MAERNTTVAGRVSDLLETPTVPNFLRLRDGGSVSVGRVTDSVLRVIARRWCDELLANAKRKNGRTAMPSDPTRDAEQAVQSAVDHLAKWPQSMNRDEFLADVEVLLTAVRQAERAKIEAVLQSVVAIGPHAVGASGDHAIEEMRLVANLAQTVRAEERARIRGIVEEHLQVIMRDVARWGWNTEKRSSSSAYESVLAALSSEGT